MADKIVKRQRRASFNFMQLFLCIILYSENESSQASMVESELWHNKTICSNSPILNGRLPFRQDSSRPPGLFGNLLC